MPTKDRRPRRPRRGNGRGICRTAPSRCSARETAQLLPTIRTAASRSTFAILRTSSTVDRERTGVALADVARYVAARRRSEQGCARAGLPRNADSPSGNLEYSTRCFDAVLVRRCESRFAAFALFARRSEFRGVRRHRYSTERRPCGRLPRGLACVVDSRAWTVISGRRGLGRARSHSSMARLKRGLETSGPSSSSTTCSARSFGASKLTPRTACRVSFGRHTRATTRETTSSCW